MTAGSRYLAAAGVLVAVAGGRMGAQEPAPGVAAAPVLQAWSFGDPLAQDSTRISRVSQVALPLSAYFPLGTAWAFDVAGAYVRGTVRREGVADLALDGMTDVRLRLAGRLGDRLMLTLGLTLPTGATRLGEHELEAVRIIGAPVMRMPVPGLGSGFGASAGVVAARRAGPWALALGTSIELRGTYQPVETVLAGVTAATDLDPGEAVHVSLGADRILGQHRLAFLVVADVYGEDALTLGAGVARQTSTYRLGPTFRALALADLGVRGYRQFSLHGQLRHRSAFTGIDGQVIDGSSGTVLDAGISTVRGTPGRTGLILRADVMLDTGLEVDNSLATAGATIGSVTVGLSLPAGRSALEPWVRWHMGTVDTGPAASGVTGGAAGLTIGRR